MVEAHDDTGQVTLSLSEKFQALIDSVAMQLGMQDEAAYLEHWARLPGGDRPGSARDGALRRAPAAARATVPRRPNRVHPLTRADHNNNVGAHAPEVTYAFEPDADWLDVTPVHKGGLFGSDSRMLFPADGIGGIKRFFVDPLAQFGNRRRADPPAYMAVRLRGTKDR